MPSYYQPLPKRSLWVDNFVSFAGLLQPEARNVLLTNGLPTSAPSLLGLLTAAKAFHSYPYLWYGDTVLNPARALMCDRWSVEQGGFAGVPGKRSVLVQFGSEFNLSPITYEEGRALLVERYQKYLSAFESASLQTLPGGQAFGVVSGQALATGPVNAWDMIVHLSTSSRGGGSFAPNSGPGPLSTSRWAEAVLPMSQRMLGSRWRCRQTRSPRRSILC